MGSKRFRKGKTFAVLEDLKNIRKISGDVRIVSIAIQDNVNEYGDIASEYGSLVNDKESYHFSSGTGDVDSKLSRNRKIKKSINSIVKGSRRSKKELDSIATEVAKVAVRDVVKFVDSGGHKVWQYWKKTNGKNLIETGTLKRSITGVAKHKSGRIIYEGR